MNSMHTEPVDARDICCNLVMDVFATRIAELVASSLAEEKMGNLETNNKILSRCALQVMDT